MNTPTTYDSAPDTFVTRREDMSSFGHLALIEEYGVVCLVVHGRDARGNPCFAKIEFCYPGSGGGRSPETFRALRALRDAMKKDNVARPI